MSDQKIDPFKTLQNIFISAASINRNLEVSNDYKAQLLGTGKKIVDALNGIKEEIERFEFTEDEEEQEQE